MRRSTPNARRARTSGPRCANRVGSGLHVAEANGGAGYGFVEQAVVLEELGRAAAPGPYVPTVLAAAVLEAAGGPAAEKLLPQLVSGELTGAVALGLDEPILGGALADVIVLSDASGAWYALDASTLSVHACKSVDPTRRVARVDLGAAELPADRRLEIDGERVVELAAVLLAAEAVGVAQWCVDTASEYAKVRVQFGRPIGQFQGVKHRCADMLARTELARAAVWDAARAVREVDNGARVAIAAAAALAFEAAFLNGKDCVQTLGGIGFTWEHDAHVYLRRAMTLHELAGAPDTWRIDAARAAMDGGRRSLGADLPASAEVTRADLRAFLAEIKDLPANEQRARLVDEGYITPSWPRPWGRDAAALELLVIEEEFRAAKIRGPGSWSARGRCRTSSCTGRASSRTVGSCRRCAARSSGASCSASPAQVPTSRRLRRRRRAVTVAGS